MTVQAESKAVSEGTPTVTSDLVILREEGDHVSLTEFAEDVKRGLSQNPKCLPSKYFYDNAGSGKILFVLLVAMLQLWSLILFC